jgi:RNA polymerase sigma factor (sigma-70 family)
MASEEGIGREFERAFEELAQRRGHIFAATIRHIVEINRQRGRVEAFLDGGPVTLAADYVCRVETYYDAQHEYVASVQLEKDISVWQPLFDKLQRWAYNLLRKRLQSNPHSERLEHAVNCATNAGLAIVRSRFTYDTEFDAWVYVLLSYQVNKYVKKLPGFKGRREPEAVELHQWDDWLTNIPDPDAEKALSRYELHQWLDQAIARLPQGQRDVILALFSKEYTYGEIALRSGRSSNALYLTRLRAIQNLRKILSETDHKHR